MLHLTMEGTVLTLSVLAIILSISSLGIILLYYCCCREHEQNKYRDDGGFAVKLTIQIVVVLLRWKKLIKINVNWTT